MPYAHLYLVGIHASVGDEDSGILKSLGLVHAHLLLQEEALEVCVCGGGGGGEVR